MNKISWRWLIGWAGSPYWLIFLQVYLVGVGAALDTALFQRGMGWLGGLRDNVSDIFPAVMTLPLIGAVGGMIAGALVQWVEPAAAGSGIPQVIKFIHGFPVPMNWRVALTKLVAGTIAIGSGFPLGPEGPAIQMGASVGAEISRWLPNALMPQRLWVVIGAAAGMSAAFNAPIAGFVYVMEELLSEYTYLALLPILIASTVADFWAEVFKFKGLSLLAGANFEVLYEFKLPDITYSIVDLPFLILLGIAIGSIAPMFVKCIVQLQVFTKRYLRHPIITIGLAGLLIGILTAFLPNTFRDNTGLRDSLVAGQVDASIAAIALIAELSLTILAAGVGTPGGLFAPMLTIGAAIGLLLTALIYHLSGYMPPTLTLAGMGAFMSAVMRVPISSIIITLELTKNFEAFHPLIFSCIPAYLVAQRIDRKSLYAHILEREENRSG